MAVANYYDSFGQYPPAFLADADGKPMHSWRVLILPYLEHRELFDQYDFSQPWNSTANLKLAERMPQVYAFHGDYRPGIVTTNYLAVIGEKTLWPGAVGKRTQEITDDSSSTIMIVENMGQNVHWMEPRDLDYETMSLRVNSPTGVSSKYEAPNVALVDGSIRRLEINLPEDVFRALLTASGGEPIAAEGTTWRVQTDGRLRKERQRDDNSLN